MIKEPIKGMMVRKSLWARITFDSYLPNCFPS